MPCEKKMDTATTLEEAYKYVRFLQSQVNTLQSMPLESSFALQNEFFSFSAVLRRYHCNMYSLGTGSTTANALSSGAMPSSSNLQAATATSVKPPASFFGLTPMDFSPALAAFFDEEDCNDDQYIEIALERPMNGDHPDDGSNQLEFCISFSSSVPFLQLPNCGLARADTMDSIGSVDNSVPFLPNCGLARADTVDSIATVDSIRTEFSTLLQLLYRRRPHQPLPPLWAFLPQTHDGGVETRTFSRR
ncbi:hypothetical protein Pint_14159 [Pistacia integerrima]|uniref:Uncharacterized protein n=1 Tax=Pistacia integerrima TaxID=434235 RepID=A0ACC0Y6S1_9ROSI|nr:hypothetical protein Pint_14159 [Pistacia integerrima]